MLVLGGLLVSELIVGVGERMLMPESPCRSNLGGSALVVLVIGVLTFVFVALGTFWQRFLGRRMQGHAKRTFQHLREANPAVAERVAARATKFSAGTRLTESMWNHPWLTASVAAAFAVVLFGAVIVLGTLTQAGTCG
jgi:hypothetical protein